MIHIANPIYDSVFKYLMEDERVARTLLSALLKKEVVSVEMRRNEYANVGRRDISMFRIDFGAKVREADGKKRYDFQYTDRYGYTNTVGVSTSS